LWYVVKMTFSREDGILTKNNLRLLKGKDIFIRREGGKVRQKFADKGMWYLQYTEISVS